MLWLAIILACGVMLLCSAAPPVKEREDPVHCQQCGRPTWALQCKCVYCRLGWPDPNKLRPNLMRAMMRSVMPSDDSNPPSPRNQTAPQPTSAEPADSAEPTMLCERCEARTPKSETDRLGFCPRCGWSVLHLDEES